MTDDRLRRVFEEVQRRKNIAPATLPPEMTDQIRDKLREELPDMHEEHVERILEVTIGGMGWVASMLSEHDLSFLTAWGIAESLADSVKDGMSGTGYAPEQGVDAGVGAGLWTGMWVAFLIAEEEAANERVT